MIKKFMRLGYVDANVLMKELDKFCSVNRTLAVENEALKKYQKVGVFRTPKEAYSNAGIKMLKWPNGARIVDLPKVYPHLKPYLDKKVRKGV